MRPRPFSRGHMQAVEYVASLAGTFNEATAFQPWKPIVCIDEAFDLLPSTRPRPFSRGNIHDGRQPKSTFRRLQRGHGLSAVETTTNPSTPCVTTQCLQRGHG